MNAITICTGNTKLYLCNKCKKYKSFECFNKDKSTLNGDRDGLCRECRKCQRERYYYERNRLTDNNKALIYKLKQALKGTQRRSKVKNCYTDLTYEYLRYLWDKQNGKCALTGIDMTYTFYEGRINTNLSVDRIDSTKGYTKDNVQLVCMAVNQMKNDLTYEELLYFCNAVLQKSKKK